MQTTWGKQATGSQATFCQCDTQQLERIGHVERTFLVQVEDTVPPPSRYLTIDHTKWLRAVYSGFETNFYWAPEGAG